MLKTVNIEKPHFVVSFQGRMDEGFQSGMLVKLKDPQSKESCQRIISRVIEYGNGYCNVILH